MVDVFEQYHNQAVLFTGSVIFANVRYRIAQNVVSTTQASSVGQGISEVPGIWIFVDCLRKAVWHFRAFDKNCCERFELFVRTLL